MDIKELAQKAAEGIQPTKEQLMEMTQRELYDFTILVEKMKKKLEQKRKQDKLLEQVKEKKSIVVKCKDNSEWIVTAHAIERFMARGPQGCDALELITRDLDKLTPARENKRHRAVSLLNHNFEGAKYYFGKCTGLLYLVVNKNVVKTCHKNVSKRWKRMI